MGPSLCLGRGPCKIGALRLKLHYIHGKSVLANTVPLWIWRRSATFVTKPKAGRWSWQKIGCNICQIWSNGNLYKWQVCLATGSDGQVYLARIMTRTDFGSSRFSDDEDRVGPQNAVLLAVQPLDGSASPRIFYWKWIACHYLFMFVVVWIPLAHNRDQWQVFVNTIMNLRLSSNAESLLTPWRMCSMALCSQQ